MPLAERDVLFRQRQMLLLNHRGPSAGKYRTGLARQCEARPFSPAAAVRSVALTTPALSAKFKADCALESNKT